MSSLTRSMSTRIAKKLEKPKPLKIIPGRIGGDSHVVNKNQQVYDSSEHLVKSEAAFDQLQDTYRLLDLVSEAIHKKDYCNILTLTNELVQRLRNHGAQLEENCMESERLEKIFEMLRSGINEVFLDFQTRLNLLQIIELRASRWQPPVGFFSYYNKRSPQQELFETSGEMMPDNEQQFLGPGEVLKPSGKYGCPLKIPGKNYCKDEVVIRNADSGKVNPGAKERLVQITGPGETKIMMARQLIEDTIKRNASPVREMTIAVGTREVGGSNSSINSSASDESSRLPSSTASTGRAVPLSSKEYRYSVRINDDIINISSTNLELLNDAKILLDSTYVDNSSENNNNNDNSKIIRSDCKYGCSRQSSLNSIDHPPEPQNKTLYLQSADIYDSSSTCDTASESAHSIVTRNNAITTGIKKEYSKEFLLDCSTSKASLMKPYNWDYIAKMYPEIIKEHPIPFDAIAYQKRWLENEVKLTLISINSDEFLDSE